MKRVPQHLAGLVVLRVPRKTLIKTIVGLYWLGAFRVATTLLLNFIFLPFQSREKIFKRHSLPILKANSVNEPWFAQWVRDHKIDLVANLRTRSIYKKEILSAPRLGCINIHHGLLPEYRGTLCDLYALAENRPAGFTIHEMNEKIDDGKILVRQERSFPATPTKDYIQYLNESGQDEGFALANLIEAIARNDRMPEGVRNECPRPTMTRTPDRREVRRLKEAGMIL